jgi:hypothetical protein
MTGCFAKTEMTNPGGVSSTAQLEQELQAAHKAFTSIEQELHRMKDGVPPEVYRALATYVFNEFKQGRPPLDLIEGDNFEFWVGIAEGQNRDPVRSKEEIDFRPLLEWFQGHPDTAVESIEIWPGSENGRVWMNIKTTDGYYVRVAFIAYQLRAFTTSEAPLPWE